MPRTIKTKGRGKIDTAEDKLWDEKEVKKKVPIKQFKTIPKLRRAKQSRTTYNNPETQEDKAERSLNSGQILVFGSAPATPKHTHKG